MHVVEVLGAGGGTMWDIVVFQGFSDLAKIKGGDPTPAVVTPSADTGSVLWTVAPDAAQRTLVRSQTDSGCPKWAVEDGLGKVLTSRPERVLQENVQETLRH